MAGDQLVRGAGRDVVDGEPPVSFRGNLGMEDHLQQQVTQLLAQMIAIAGLDCLDRFGGLLDEVLR
jgi:hypothetical protein